MNKLRKRVISFVLAVLFVLPLVGGNLNMQQVQAENGTETLTLECRSWGTNKLVQVNTNLPSTITLKDFLSTDNGSEIDQSGSSQSFGYASMSKEGETVIITFNFNNALTEGQKFTLKKDSVFVFQDTTTKYVLDKDYIFVYNGGESWSLQEPTTDPTPTPTPDPAPDPTGTKPLSLQCRSWGTNKLIQVNTNLTLPVEQYNNFTADKSGYMIDQTGSAQTFSTANIDNASGTVVITFNFANEMTQGQKFVLKKGSVFAFGVKDGETYTTQTRYMLDKDYTFVYNGGDSWSIENDVNGDGRLNVADYLHLKKVFADKAEKTESCDIVNDGYVNDWDMTLMRELMLGLVQGAEDIMKRPAYVLEEYHYQGGEDFITFADMPVDSRYAEKIATFKELGFNTSLLTEDCIGGSSAVSYYGTCTTSEESAVNGEKLELTYDNTNGSLIQFRTNLPVDGTYENFLAGDKGFQINLDGSAKTPSWFALDKGTYTEKDTESTSDCIYLTMRFQENEKDVYFNLGEQQILRAGSTFTFNDIVYTLDKTYTVTICNNYLAAIENLDKAGLNVWIRNQANKEGYFTDEITAELKKYEDVIDGFYMADEPYANAELKNQNKDKDETSDYNALASTATWLNTNFPSAYYHINQVPISSYNHYGDGKTQSPEGYTSFLQSYQNTILKNLNENAGKSICFDNYPFIQSQTGETSGIAETYLLNMVLTANSTKVYNANSANGEADFGACIQTFEASAGTEGNKTSRDITKAEEVSLQLYTGMACGADLFEYFTYSSNSVYGLKGIINEDGTGRIYDLVKTANDNALCFADVINTFTWQGIETSKGTQNNANTNAFTSVSTMLLGDENNGVLSNVSSTDDAVVGCFTKAGQDGYMVVNYNDPVAVTGNNSVTLTFADCTKARVYTGSNGVLKSELVDLSNGSYTVTIAPGSACFIIPA